MSIVLDDIFKQSLKNSSDTSLVPEKITPSEKETATALVTQIEITYNFTATLPSFECLLENWEGTEVELREILINEVNPKLALRGLPTYIFTPVRVPKIKNAPDYEPLFILACNQIFSPTSSESFGARIKKLKPFGVTNATWDGWMKNPKYYDYAKNLFDQVFNRDLDMQADIAIAKKIQEGDLPTIKFYKELTGRYNSPENNNSNLNNMNIALIVGTILEILAKHVSSNVIDVVANELETSPVGELFQ